MNASGNWIPKPDSELERSDHSDEVDKSVHSPERGHSCPRVRWPIVLALSTVGLLSLGVVSPEELEATKPQLEVTQSGSNLILDWAAHPEVFYFMEGRPDLEAGTPWTTAKLLKDNEASGSLSLGTSITGSKAFYRLDLEGDPDSARLRADSDGDKIINLDEANAGWDAYAAEVPTDSDTDGIPDYFEQFHFDTLDHDASYVAAPGGLTLAEAYANATDPNETDSDGDGFPDAYEIANNLDANYNQSRDNRTLDTDLDGLTDWIESEIGTRADLVDTDGDGMTDKNDPAPTQSFQSFVDADGDGIPDDGTDPDPATARGAAPVVSSAITSSPYYVANFIKDDTVSFVVNVQNPAGNTPVASQLQFFIDGEPKPTSKEDLGDGNFALTWTAALHSSYPETIVQSASVRFVDDDGAIAYQNLTSLDVAEWEGLLMAGPYRDLSDFDILYVSIHNNGVEVSSPFVGERLVYTRLYRGAKAMTITNQSGTSLEFDLGDHVIPFVILSSGNEGAPSVIINQDYNDYVDVETALESDHLFYNGSTHTAMFDWDTAGFNFTLPSGDFELKKFNFENSGAPVGTSAIASYPDPSEPSVWKIFDSTARQVVADPQANIRECRFYSITTGNNGKPDFTSPVGLLVNSIAKITPHLSGTLEYSGMPKESITHHTSREKILLSTDEWRKFTIKIYPPVLNFNYSKGYQLNIRAGFNGDSNPNSGWAIKALDQNGNLIDVSVPADGRIEMLQSANSPLYEQLMSPDGLELFIRAEHNVNELHMLSLDALPIRTELDPVRMVSLELLKMDLDVNNDGDVTDAVDGLENYLPGYEGDDPKLNSGTTFQTAAYSGAQAVRLVLGAEIDNLEFKIKDGVTNYDGYCVNGDDPSLSGNNDEDFSFDADSNLREIDATVSNGETSAVLYCKDYGAACTIEIIVDGTILFEVNVPEDSNDDQLADAWQIEQINEWNVQNDDFLDSSIAQLSSTWTGKWGSDMSEADVEKKDPDGLGPLHSHQTEGDGLSVEKEYRGFITDFGPNHSGGHTRLSVSKKELLVEVSQMTNIQSAMTAGVNPNSISYNLQSIQSAVTDFFKDKIGIDCYWASDEVENFGGVVDYDADGQLNQPGERGFAYIWDAQSPQTQNGEVVRENPNSNPNTQRIGGGAYVTEDIKLRETRGLLHDSYFVESGVGKQIPLHLERHESDVWLHDFVKLVMITRWGRVLSPLANQPTSDVYCLVPKTSNNVSSFNDVFIYEGSLCSVVGTSEEGDVIASRNGTHYAQNEFDNVFEWVVAHELGHLFNSGSNHNGSGGIMSSSNPGTSGLSAVPASSTTESSTYDFEDKASVVEGSY